jgi:hypothetical protein
VHLEKTEIEFMIIRDVKEAEKKITVNDKQEVLVAIFR